MGKSRRQPVPGSREAKVRLVRRPTDPDQLVDIGVVHNGTVSIETMLSIRRTDIWDSGHVGRFQTLWDSYVTYIPAARNSVVKNFLGGYYDEESGRTIKSNWLLFIDHDMVFPGNLLEMLFKAADPLERPIVAGFYPTYMPDDGDVRVLPTWMYEYDGKPMRQVQELPEGNELMELHGCGMGITIIHRSVFEAIAKEWQDDEWHWFAHDIREFEPSIGPVRCGEDVTFCCRARDLGFKVWGAPSIRAKHKKVNILDAKDILPSLRIVAA